MDTTAKDGNLSARHQFSLRSVFIAIAVLSLPLTLLHWLGTYFVIPILWSTCLVIACGYVYRVDSPKRLLLVASLAVPAVFVLSFFYLMVSFRFGGTGTMVFHTLINAAVCLVLAIAGSPRWTLVPLLVVAAMVPYLLRIQETERIRGEFDQMLANHPLESIEPRLRFVKPQDGSLSDALRQVDYTELSPAVVENLSEQEQRRNWRGREWALQQLHENYNAQFAAAMGFGYMRMGRIYPEELETEPLELIQLPVPIDGDLLAENGQSGSGKLHQTVAFDFLNRNRIGYVRDKQHVSGFQSHSPTELTGAIDNSRPCDKSTDEEAFWQLTRLELVSLLRHSPPRVYLAESLPAMDQLDQFEHRALSDFERNSLSQLRATRDVVLDTSDDRILMLGSLRASNDCLVCHQGNQGQLLGAFSYEFARYEDDQSEAGDFAADRVTDRFQIASRQP